MTKYGTTLKARVNNGEVVITREVYNGRRYIPGRRKEDDLRHQRNRAILSIFLARAKEAWLDYHS